MSGSIGTSSSGKPSFSMGSQFTGLASLTMKVSSRSLLLLLCIDCNLTLIVATGDAARAHDAEALRRFGPLAADLNFHMDDSPAEMVHQHHLSYHGLFQGQPSSTLVGDVGGVGSGMNLLSSIPHNLNLGGMNTNGAGLWIPQGVEEDLDEDGLVQMHPPTSGGRRQTGGTPGGGRGRAKGRGRGRAKVESDPSASEGGGSEDSWDGSSGGRGRGNASARRVVASSRGKKRPNKDWGEDIEAKGRSYAPPPHVLSSNGHPLVAKVVSKFKGVTWDDGSSKWQAQVYEGGLMVNLGLFETQEEAARAYDASIVRSGRKERLNFPANHVRDPTSISKK